MTTQLRLVTALVAACIGMAMGTSAWAQAGSMPVPTYRSGVSAGAMSGHNFNTPEEDGRPGVRFYIEGMNAYHKGDLTHALNRLKLSAYWAYAPAAYNLGVMYFQGEGGVPMNRPLGAAWMFIAAEQGNAEYIAARHMLVTELSYSERTQALQDYRRLEQKYGDPGGNAPRQGPVGARQVAADWQPRGSCSGGIPNRDIRSAR
jgi:TPR repeat protein